MWTDLEVISGNTRLGDIFKECKRLEKDFWNIIWSQIQHFLPDDFDRNLLLTDRILTAIKTSRETPQVARVDIGNNDYCGDMKRLFDYIQPLHWKKIDGFLIEIKWFNLDNANKNHHIIHFRFIKLSDDAIEGTAVDVTERDSSLAVNRVLNLIERKD